MLPGFSGRLISEAFLERLVNDEASTDIDRLVRRLSDWRDGGHGLGPASSVRAMLHVGAEPLLSALGCDVSRDVTYRDQRLVATTLRRGNVATTLVVTGWGEPLDPLWREAVAESVARSTTWCLLFNGMRLRLIDAQRVFSRRYIEFELDRAVDSPKSVSALRVIVPTLSLRPLVEASDQYASDVCRSLQDGVLGASAAVYAALASSRRKSVDPDAAFEQALTIVYRLLFLLFAEARALVPMWHPIYRESYSLDALREAAEHRAGGLWEALRAISRMAHAGCRAGDLKVTPFNGRLFAPARTPLAERKNLDDEAGRRAVLALTTRPSADRHGRERIAYRDLGVEQLGAVYETLLDYRPAPDGARQHPDLAHLELQAGTGLRKSTGTFYTPQTIVNYLVRRTLGPLVRDLDAEQILGVRVLDPAMGSGAFLVAACRYLAAAYETALVSAGRCHASDIGSQERRAIRRIIAERCLYGVDLNPMAVQLARLSLWLTTFAADRPLSFLDHRLVSGNSVLGTWLALLGKPPGPRNRRRSATDTVHPLFGDLGTRDLLREVLPLRFALESTPNDTVEQVRDKERTLALMQARGSTLQKWKQIADLWCAGWLAGEVIPVEAYGALTDAALGRESALSPRAVQEYLTRAGECARRHGLFHWELEYPEVFFAADGTRLPDAGFDALLGNPPWDMLRADPGAAREVSTRTVRFTRDSGAYQAQADGHANCYQLFVERAVSLTRTGGRVGLVLPAGLATDRGSASLRQLLLRRCDIDALVGFENHRRIFPIHRDIRFLLLTAAAGRASETVACRFGVRDPAELEAVGEEPAASCRWFTVRLGARSLSRFSGRDLAIPWLRSQVDLMLCERAASLFPPLGHAEGWDVRFGRELNATEDRRLFTGPGEGLPVVGGRHIHPFVVDLPSSRWAVTRRDADARLPDARHTRPRLGYRDVAGAANQLTLIAAIVPPGCLCTHTVFTLRTTLTSADQLFLCALFNSYMVNYLVRLRVGTHVTTTMVEQLPMPRRDHAPGAAEELAALARVLAKGPDPHASARLQARIAGLYQLSLEEFEYVLTTFPLVPQSQKAEAVRAFRGL